MSEPPQVPEPAGPASIEPAPADLRGLRFLRGLVTTLTAVMILGMVTMVWLFVTRLPDASAPAPGLVVPDTLELPPGATAQAVTAGQGWFAVVTRAGEILIFDAEGALLRRIAASELAVE